jgi:hypothetical protein
MANGYYIFHKDRLGNYAVIIAEMANSKGEKCDLLY